ncbi:beta-1,3-galactosyl-O-glycosyl-glycoprotein beta-1,6-N-acetylglucosaminyltransferase-like [Biomphalaria glabrata]|uniref:Beta-1,3-galactosyl-O-glycosyl-glycoprotein beta-1,6-N-acetylglucosaminyltransferase-like n=1 Tax=Biomphalaria glabrata TaxID=6526 RepID=A0A9W2YRB2_BIOGL|nr:beta-1,3-galactosyl-O-glycosyl-glycoprotein beta-1,6-N-acetylglucosaminyltransferase-like [Biomphalaria glabrata]
MIIHWKRTESVLFTFLIVICPCFILIIKQSFHSSRGPVIVENVIRTFNGTKTYTPSAESDNCGSNLVLLRQLEEIAKKRKVPDIDCSAIFSANEEKLKEAVNIAKASRGGLKSAFYLNATQSCQDFQKSRGYVTSSLTSEEGNFPLAFSLILYADLEMAERLLRAVYRPQNVYCLHVDRKVSVNYLKAITAVAACFPNVFISSKRVNVVWGKFSVLKAELICMEELWQYSSWKYFINLAGQEFPLRTNLELVRILKAFNGANSVSGRIKKNDERRWSNAPPLSGIQPVKGSVHIVVNRHYVDFILHTKAALKLLKWTKRTRVPDETFFPTLNFNPQLSINGSYSGSPNEIQQSINRYKIWYTQELCAGRLRRGICILSTGDLPRLGQSKHLFANKFLIHEDSVVIGCLEEKLANETRDEYACRKMFDATWYSRLDFVQKQIRTYGDNV